MIDHIKKADKDLDSVLAKQPVFLKLERQTGLKKTHLVYTVVAALSFVLLYQVATEPVVALALFAYPLFLSLEAVESHDKAKDAHILSYWSVLAALQLLEVLVPFLFRYIPFYQLAKIVLAAWMYLPQTKGSLLLYDAALKPVLAQVRTLRAPTHKVPLKKSASESHDN